MDSETLSPRSGEMVELIAIGVFVVYYSLYLSYDLFTLLSLSHTIALFVYIGAAICRNLLELNYHTNF